MNRIPAPSTSSSSSSEGLAPGTLDDTAHWEPGNPVPALQLPPTLNLPAAQGSILDVMRAALAAFQGSFELPAAGQGWMLPDIPQPVVGQSSGASTSGGAMEMDLKKWVDEATTPAMAESRRTAEGRILAVLRGNDELNLDGLTLGTLPDLFDHPDASRGLRFVKIANCPLDTLPASLLRHPNLQNLDVQSCALRHLPEFGEMPKLEFLNLSSNRLTELPASIGGLGSLMEINLESNRLESLPGSIGRLAKLGELSVFGNRLQQLPDTLDGMRSLETLNVSGNPLTDLPESIRRLPLMELGISATDLQQLPPVLCSMTRLQELRLHETPLTTLPPEIAGMSGLRTLNLVDCQITSLPEEIAQLPEACTVDLSGNPLSQTIIDNLLDMDEGPQIHFSVDDGDGVENRATQPLETNVAKWVKDLSPEQAEKWKQKGNDEQASHFNTWLELMDQTADYRNLQTRPHLEERMQSLLKDLTRMLEDPKDTQLPIYLGIAEEATSTCRDRIAVGLNNMELQQVNLRASRGELSSSQLMTLGREMFIRDQIGHIAAAKVKGLRGVDEVEVHLAFQVGLQKPLGLTLGNRDMLYRAVSQVGGTDLERAVRDIQQQLNTRGLLRDFLADWEPMRQFVRQQHPADWQRIEQTFEALEEQAYGQDGNTDWAALEGLGARREQAFHDLCASKVAELMETDLPSSSRPPEDPPPGKRPRLD